jgi:hypothetical protein
MTTLSLYIEREIIKNKNVRDRYTCVGKILLRIAKQVVTGCHVVTGRGMRGLQP